MLNTKTLDTTSALGKPEYIAILFFLILLTGYTVYEVYDELTDLAHGESPLTVWLEILIVSASLGFIFYITRLLYKNIKQQKQMAQSLKQVREQLHSSNQRLQQGKEAFRETIEWQLNEWQFTQAQKDISILLLKGLTIKEIASQRHVQEKTIRNHLSAIYEKSGLPGRHVFCSWFVEGLF
ncbi:MAG: helix-turn-helix transcriptional regulator [Leucothrix sp.]